MRKYLILKVECKTVLSLTWVFKNLRISKKLMRKYKRNEKN